MPETVQLKKRNSVYDCAKGIGILLVVMGHCYTFGYEFFTRFHVLFFFIFAGLMLKSESLIDFESLKQNIAKFCKRYALPYIICNAFFLAFYNIFVKAGLITFDSRYAFDASYITLNVFIGKITKIFLLIASSEQLCGATWFLRSLFWGLLSVAIILFLTKKINKVLVYAFVSIGLILLTILYHNKLLILFSQSVICIIIGDILKQYINHWKLNIYWFITAILIMIFIKSIVNIELINIIIYAICGFIFIYYLALTLEKYLQKISNLMSYLGKNTMPILCLHLLAFKIVTYFYILLTQCDISLLGAFPAIKSVNHAGLLAFLYTVVGISLPIAVYKIYLLLKNIVIIRLRVKNG